MIPFSFLIYQIGYSFSFNNEIKKIYLALYYYLNDSYSAIRLILRCKNYYLIKSFILNSLP